MTIEATIEACREYGLEPKVLVTPRLGTLVFVQCSLPSSDPRSRGNLARCDSPRDVAEYADLMRASA